MNLSETEFCQDRITIYDIPASKRSFISQLSSAIDVCDFDLFLITIDIQTATRGGTHWKKRKFKSNNLFDYEEITHEEYLKLNKNDLYDYKLNINERNNEWCLCYLKDDTRLHYVDESGNLSKYMCVGGKGLASTRFVEFLKEIGSDFKFDGLKTCKETKVVGYYRTLKIERESFEVVLEFKTTKKTRLFFQWNKSGQCYSLKIDDGIRTKSMGLVTIDPETANVLKNRFEKEPDSSYGNPKIARRMKKYLNV